MGEAVRTTQSTFGIWVIVAVAMISLAVWLVGIYVADNYQSRLSRQRRRMEASRPVLDEAGASAAASSIPGQRGDAGQPEPETETEPASEPVAARGKHARPAAYYAAADFYGMADYKAAEKTPAGNAQTGDREAGGAAGGQADAPTRPDLPAQTPQSAQPYLPQQRTQGGQAGQAGQAEQAEQAEQRAQAEQAEPTGRHAMPSQRSGDSDRAERTYVGPEANRGDDQDDQDQR